MKRRISMLIALILAFSCLFPMGALAAQEEITLPFVKQYTKGIDADGAFTLAEDARILIIEDSKTIGNDVLFEYTQLVNEEIAVDQGLASSFPIYLAKSAAQAKTGDIIVTLDYTPTSRFDEEYEILIGETVTISSASARGILYGLRTFAKLAKDGTLAYASVVDYPDVEMRTFHLDNGRYNYSRDWIIDRVKQMSYLKMNTLELHFSENEGFGIECKTVPGLAGENALSYDDVREVLEVAKRYGVDVVPSLDSPGHLGALINLYPEYGLKQLAYEDVPTTDENGDPILDQQGNPVTHKEPKLDDDGNQATEYVVYGNVTQCDYASALDFSIPEAKELIYKIYDEYAGLFEDAPYFNICADEFVEFSGLNTEFPSLKAAATEAGFENVIDYFVTYVNELASYLEKRGFTIQVFNDPFYRNDNTQTVDLKPSIEVCYWTLMSESQAKVETFIEKGHKLHNFCDKVIGLGANGVDMSTFMASIMYYVNTQQMYQHPTGSDLFTRWHPGLFSNWKVITGLMTDQGFEKGSYTNDLKGASFCVWNDTNTNASADETPEQTAQGIREPLNVMAQLCWSANLADCYESYDIFKSTALVDENDMPGFTDGFASYQPIRNLTTTSGSSSSGGSTGTVTYTPVINTAANGQVTVSPKSPSRDTKVTITVAPNEGYELDVLAIIDASGSSVEYTGHGNGTYTFVQPKGKVTITATFRKLGNVADCDHRGTCPAYPFADLDLSLWYHDGIHFCVDQGLMAGTSATTFAPDMYTNRAMVVTILWRLAGSPAASGTMCYEDVAEGQWYTEAVRWGASTGIVKGYDTGGFGPDDPITREQMAAFLYRYANALATSGTLGNFTDSKPSAWAEDAVKWAVEQGILTGKGNAILDPQGKATRAETAAMLQRFAAQKEG